MNRTIELMYTNWRGEKRLRTISDMEAPFWGSNEWHLEPQWLFDAWDDEAGKLRTFALKDCDFTVRP